MQSCLLDFELTDAGAFRLKQFGEQTGPEIMKNAYPILNKALAAETFEEHTMEEISNRPRRRSRQRSRTRRTTVPLRSLRPAEGLRPGRTAPDGAGRTQRARSPRPLTGGRHSAPTMAYKAALLSRCLSDRSFGVKASMRRPPPVNKNLSFARSFWGIAQGGLPSCGGSRRFCGVGGTRPPRLSL
jgi:hypothetical protein